MIVRKWLADCRLADHRVMIFWWLHDKLLRYPANIVRQTEMDRDFMQNILFTSSNYIVRE